MCYFYLNNIFPSNLPFTSLHSNRSQRPQFAIVTDITRQRIVLIQTEQSVGDPKLYTLFTYFWSYLKKKNILSPSLNSKHINTKKPRPMSGEMGALWTSLPTVRGGGCRQLMFKPGEIMIEEDPYVCSVDSTCLGVICSYCIGRGAELKCPRCNIVGYCSAGCKVHGGFGGIMIIVVGVVSYSRGALLIEVVNIWNIIYWYIKGYGSKRGTWAS